MKKKEEVRRESWGWKAPELKGGGGGEGGGLDPAAITLLSSVRGELLDIHTHTYIYALQARSSVCCENILCHTVLVCPKNTLISSCLLATSRTRESRTVIIGICTHPQGQLVQPATGMATAAAPHPHIWQPGIWPWPRFTACGGPFQVCISQKHLGILSSRSAKHSWTPTEQRGP